MVNPATLRRSRPRITDHSVGGVVRKAVGGFPPKKGATHLDTVPNDEEGVQTEITTRSAHVHASKDGCKARGLTFEIGNEKPSET